MKHIILAVLLVHSLSALGWGAKGHSAIACIAQAHLSRSAQREVARLLDGHNMSYWSSWADGLRDDPRYDGLTTWHYANAEDGCTYDASPRNPAGDVCTAVQSCIQNLEERGASDSLRSLNLKLLIHFVGDMHCPMHAGRESDRGGNDYPLRLFDTQTNLHALWDSALIDAARPWSASEWATNIDYKMSRTQRHETEGGTPLEWMEQTTALSHAIYADTPRGGVLAWPYINRYTPLIERQFMEAGYRLARILNEIM